jgi:hypothetical protein
MSTWRRTIACVIPKVRKIRSATEVELRTADFPRLAHITCTSARRHPFLFRDRRIDFNSVCLHHYTRWCGGQISSWICHLRWDRPTCLESSNKPQRRPFFLYSMPSALPRRRNADLNPSVATCMTSLQLKIVLIRIMGPGSYRARQSSLVPVPWPK